MRLIIIDHEPYSDRKRQIYNIDSFIKDNFNVEFWSVVNCMPYTSDDVIESYNFEDDDCVIYIKTYEDLLDQISKLDPNNTIVILEIYFRWSTIQLFKLLNQLKIQYVKLDFYLNPIIAFANINKTKKLLLSLNLKNLKVWLKNIFQIKLLNKIDNCIKFNNYETLFITGSNNPFTNKNVVSLNYFDVEIDIQIKNQSSIIEGNYIVFLDTNLPSHPDLKRDKLETISSKVYYQKLNLFFDKIEKKTGYNIIIAAHPHSNYTQEFLNRKVIKNNTAILVKHCKFVILHESTSMNFALMNRKPIVLIYFNEFITYKNYLTEIYLRMEKLSRYFEIPLINIDMEIEDIRLTFNEYKYDEYLWKYIYSTQFPKSNYEILKNEFIRILNR